MAWFDIALLCIQLVSFMGQGLTAWKRRLCTDFEIDNKRAQHDVLFTHSGLSKRHCMMTCAADARCIAFNFRSGDGFCELLPELAKCYEPDDDNDFIFTQLKLADFKLLMAKQSKPPNTSNLQWVPYNSTATPSSYNIQVDNVRYVGLGFYKGMYLPAYWIASKKVVRFLYPPDNKRLRCDNGYLLNVQNPDQYKWVTFKVGNSISIGSVSAGSHVDATPLYIARVICEDGTRSGFYTYSVRMVYVACQKVLYPEGEIELLLHVWYE